MRFTNTYNDRTYADAYATLEFGGTYYLAYRDLPEIISRHAVGRRAIDFGCGAGRSTRFLRALGFDTVGVDVSQGMLARAREIDPGGDYRHVGSGRLDMFPDGAFDLGLSAFTFDNIPTMTEKVALCRQLRRLLLPDGCLVNVVSTPEIYTHEWASFSTKDFPANWRAKPGDIVNTRITAIGDRRPVDDVFWPDACYRAVFRQASLDVAETHRPLARGDEPFDWVSEREIAPWAIYVLKPGASPIIDPWARVEVHNAATPGPASSHQVGRRVREGGVRVGLLRPGPPTGQGRPVRVSQPRSELAGDLLVP